MRRVLRAVLAAAAVVLAAAGAFAAAAWQATPPAAHLAQRVELRLRGTGARTVPLSAVSPDLVRALVATEDERFYRHHGIDLIGIARAVPYDLVHVSFAQGASTLTEQVAKLLYLNGNDHTPWRKLEDMALAVKLENRYSKQAILDAYLNTAYFGDGAYGIAAASRRYFGVAPSRLDLAQASLLAGLPQAPSAYEPFLHPAAARARQVAVLRSLVRVGAIRARRAQAVAARPLRLRGGARLPPDPGVSMARGPALDWVDAGAGVALLLLALVLARARRLARRTPVVYAALVAAAVVLVLGAATVLRSIRTL